MLVGTSAQQSGLEVCQASGISRGVSTPWSGGEGCSAGVCCSREKGQHWRGSTRIMALLLVFHQDHSCGASPGPYMGGRRLHKRLMVLRGEAVQKKVQELSTNEEMGSLTMSSNPQQIKSPPLQHSLNLKRILGRKLFQVADKAGLLLLSASSKPHFYPREDWKEGFPIHTSTKILRDSP